jgi:hypothetical protein
MKPRVGAGLSLDALAKAKKSTFDKRKVIEKARELKARQLKKYRRLQKRLGLAPSAAGGARVRKQLVPP